MYNVNGNGGLESVLLLFILFPSRYTRIGNPADASIRIDSVFYENRLSTYENETSIRALALL